MHRLGVLFCAIGPSLVLLQYGIAKARARWDDQTIWEAFFSGGLAIVFVLLPQMLLKQVFAVDAMSAVHGAATQAFIIAAVPEETAKFAVTLWAIKRYAADDGQHDLITTALAVALGFAAIENLAYLLAPGEWRVLAAGRAVLSVPIHGLTGLAMGSFLMLARLHPRQRRMWFTVALAVPMLLHACYDFPLMLVAKRDALVGILPAWFVMIVLSTICIVWLSNHVRASAEHVHVAPDRPSSPRFTGAALLLLVPFLAGVALVGAAGFGILGAAALTVLPTIMGIDLICTSSKASSVSV
jgi:RsiW-degrading membrane proteinase PrsW (M82 family)